MRAPAAARELPDADYRQEDAGTVRQGTPDAAGLSVLVGSRRFSDRAPLIPV